MHVKTQIAEKLTVTSESQLVLVSFVTKKKEILEERRDRTK